MKLQKEWFINPVIEALAKHYGLDPAATDQWAIAMGDYPDNDVTEEDIKPAYWQARIKYAEFLNWLNESRFRFPHSVSEADERIREWLNLTGDRPLT